MPATPATTGTSAASTADAARQQQVLHHRVEGSGPVVVLLHAGVADLRMWDVQVADLAADHRVVRCDLRGFGGSPLPAGDRYSDAADVIALLDELGVESFALVGASYGGWVALQVASALADRVTRLVLLASAAKLVDRTPALAAYGAEEERLLEADDVDGATDLNVRTWLGPEADEPARELVREMQRRAFEVQIPAGDVDDFELDVDWSRLTMPTLVVTGAHDFDFFLVTARELAGRLPDAELVELPWAGHLPSLERPAEATRLIRAALDR
jgi:3-oxoadipate enol-lactonase